MSLERDLEPMITPARPVKPAQALVRQSSRGLSVDAIQHQKPNAIVSIKGRVKRLGSFKEKLSRNQYVPIHRYLNSYWKMNLFKNKDKEMQLTARGYHIIIHCSSHIAAACHVTTRGLIILSQHWRNSSNSGCSSHYTKCCDNCNCHKQYFRIHMH
jgi:hypothetical protein